MVLIPRHTGDRRIDFVLLLSNCGTLVRWYIGSRLKIAGVLISSRGTEHTVPIARQIKGKNNIGAPVRVPNMACDRPTELTGEARHTSFPLSYCFLDGKRSFPYSASCKRRVHSLHSSIVVSDSSPWSPDYPRRSDQAVLG